MPPPKVHPSRNRRWILKPNSVPTRGVHVLVSPCVVPPAGSIPRAWTGTCTLDTTSNSQGKPEGCACAVVDVNHPNTASPSTAAVNTSNPHLHPLCGMKGSRNSPCTKLFSRMVTLS